MILRSRSRVNAETYGLAVGDPSWCCGVLVDKEDEGGCGVMAHFDLWLDGGVGPVRRCTELVLLLRPAVFSLLASTTSKVSGGCVLSAIANVT
jgi:hypothetical protein